MRYKKEGQSVKVIGNIWTNIRKHCIAQQSLLIKGITIKIMMQLITSQQYLGWGLSDLKYFNVLVWL